MTQVLDPVRWARISEVFAAVVEKAPDARAEFLAAACGTDQVLRAEVESLLAFDGPAGIELTRRIEQMVAEVVNRTGT